MAWTDEQNIAKAEIAFLCSNNKTSLILTVNKILFDKLLPEDQLQLLPDAEINQYLFFAGEVDANLRNKNIPINQAVNVRKGEHGIVCTWTEIPGASDSDIDDLSKKLQIIDIHYAPVIYCIKIINKSQAYITIMEEFYKRYFSIPPVPSSLTKALDVSVSTEELDPVRSQPLGNPSEFREVLGKTSGILQLRKNMITSNPQKLPEKRESSNALFGLQPIICKILPLYKATAHKGQIFYYKNPPPSSNRQGSSSSRPSTPNTTSETKPETTAPGNATVKQAFLPSTRQGSNSSGESIPIPIAVSGTKPEATASSNTTARNSRLHSTRQSGNSSGVSTPNTTSGTKPEVTASGNATVKQAFLPSNRQSSNSPRESTPNTTSGTKPEATAPGNTTVRQAYLPSNRQSGNSSGVSTPNTTSGTKPDATDPRNVTVIGPSLPSNRQGINSSFSLNSVESGILPPYKAVESKEQGDSSEFSGPPKSGERPSTS